MPVESALNNPWAFAIITGRVIVFHKSQDPNYKKAVPTHDWRVAEFIEPFQNFVGKKR